MREDQEFAVHALELARQADETKGRKRKDELRRLSLMYLNLAELAAKRPQQEIIDTSV